MRPFLDLNVLLDYFLSRSPWTLEAQAIFRAHRLGTFRAVIAAHSVTNGFYIVRKQLGLVVAFASVDECVAEFEILSVTAKSIQEARTFTSSDLEDCLQLACAIEGQVDTIVTRNTNDFRNKTIPVETPADFVARLQLP